MTGPPDPIAHWLQLGEYERGAWRGFLRAHDGVVRALDQALSQRHGLSLPGYDLLVRLSRAPDPGLQMSQLAEAVRFSRGGLTHLAQRLERDGLLVRRRGAHDPRRVYAALTESGARRLAEATPDVGIVVRERFLAALSDEQVAQLRVIVDALIAHNREAVPVGGSANPALLLDPRRTG